MIWYKTRQKTIKLETVLPFLYVYVTIEEESVRREELNLVALQAWDWLASRQAAQHSDGGLWQGLICDTHVTVIMVHPGIWMCPFLAPSPHCLGPGFLEGLCFLTCWSPSLFILVFLPVWGPLCQFKGRIVAIKEIKDGKEPNLKCWNSQHSPNRSSWSFVHWT